MAHMDRWTHPALHKVVPADPMLMDGLESLGQLGQFDWGSLISSGLDFLGTKKQLDIQEDQLKAQLAAAREMKAAALLKLEAAKVEREAMQIQAVADVKAKQAQAAGFGLDVGKMIIPIAAAGVVLVVLLMRKR